MTDTIFALATPAGQSAIALFRISGIKAYEIAEKLSGKSLSHRQLTPCLLKDEAGALLDDVMMVYLQAPATPTGEDVVEIHCHGSFSVVGAISDYLSRADRVRPAVAGEFTKRAFDNGKMDLTEVEGLADLIEAQTQSQRRQALGQLKGVMRKKATSWRAEIVQLSARLESVIDFSDEDLPDSVLQEVRAKRDGLIAALRAVLDDEGRGEIIRNGLRVALLGPVNAGKSTALNALAGREAAIVSDEAGTTRDIVEVRLDLDGITVVLQDTAGIRDKAGHVESIGIARAKEAAAQADLVVLMADGSKEAWQKQADALLASLAEDVSCPVIKIVNKADTMKNIEASGAYMPLTLHKSQDVQRLEEALLAYCKPLNLSSEQPFITRDRHRLLVTKALEALTASYDIALDEAPELVAEDLRVAADALGQMTGHIDVEDILSDIFSSFCIGK